MALKKVIKGLIFQCLTLGWHGFPGGCLPIKDSGMNETEVFNWWHEIQLHIFSVAIIIFKMFEFIASS